MILPKDIFCENRKRGQVFTKNHQILVKMFMKQDISIVLSGNDNLIKNSNCYDENYNCNCFNEHHATQPPCVCLDSVYHQYINHLFKKHTEFTQDYEIMDFKYRNILQHPLQPLMENLSGSTYQVFENDLPKYIMYEKAIQTALVDYYNYNKFNSTINKGNSPTFEVQEEKFREIEFLSKEMLRKKNVLMEGRDKDAIQIMVFGAGRGPLIIRCINASQNCGIPIRIIAVDKNRYAIIELKKLIEKYNIRDIVTLIQGDMREVELDVKADIVVSELLGSFGDNELSPECLFPVQKHMNEGAISIP